MKGMGVVALLCVLVSLPVQAEQSLRFFGRLSVHGYNVDARDQDSTTVVDDKSLNSRIGFVFTQELNDHITGVGQVEWNFQPTEAESFAQQRETYVGVRSDFGQLALGTFNGAYKTTGGVMWDPFVTTPLESRRQAGMAGGAYAQNAFLRRMIEYRTPVVSGLSGKVQYGLDRRDTTVAGSYGDVSAGVQYQFREELELIGAVSYADSEASDENLNWKVGARWRPGNFTLAVQYEDVEIRKGGHRIDYATVTADDNGSRSLAGKNFITSAQDEDEEVTGINSSTTHLFAHASYRYKAHEVHAIYGNMAVKDVNASDINAFTLGYTHWFSGTFRFIGGVQYQARQSNWESGDVVVTSAGLRYDFGGSFP